LLCREEAAALAALLPKLHAQGVRLRLIGVVKETTNVAGFLPYFPGGEVFVDRQRAVYNAMGGIKSSPWALLAPQIWYRVYKSWRAGANNVNGGEGLKLGGVIVIGAEDQGVLYEFKEASIGEHAPIDDVYQACLKIKAKL
jgi:hypothetical protein